MGGWGWDEDPPDANAERLFSNSRRVYDRIASLVDDATDSGEMPLVTPSLVCEFHKLATNGDPDPRVRPGLLRTVDVQIGRIVVQRTPPPWQAVPTLLREHCEIIRRRMLVGTPLDAAAYALWSINWIHPYGDGNGKTARAVMYLILCLGFGRMIPGEPALPDLIAQNPYSYIDALVQSHKIWEREHTANIEPVEQYLFELLKKLLSIDDHAQRPSDVEPVS